MPSQAVSLVGPAPDDKNFVVARLDASRQSTQINVVVGWFRDLNEKFASKE
jgi:hypothetical protein